MRSPQLIAGLPNARGLVESKKGFHIAVGIKMAKYMPSAGGSQLLGKFGTGQQVENDPAYGKFIRPPFHLN